MWIDWVPEPSLMPSPRRLYLQISTFTKK
jgi:hypothetical protein